MPDHEHDRLEQFFRKAAGKADVTFNEEDWKKLEARLDASAAAVGTAKRTGTRVAAVIVIVALLLAPIRLWINSSDDVGPESDPGVNKESMLPPLDPLKGGDKGDKQVDKQNERTPIDRGLSQRGTLPDGRPERDPNQTTGLPPKKSQQLNDRGMTAVTKETNIASEMLQNNIPGGVERPHAFIPGEEPSGVISEQEISAVDEGSLAILSSPGHEETESPEDSERNKQKAVVELPGAEEEQTREAPAMVQEEYASDKKKHAAAPRLSLLLSFAPDFSGTSMGLSSSPGKAFGAMVHYHPFDRWSISAGAVKNYKVYTGAGEDYKPPKNYWKYYTNGVIPESIDGSCSIIEFPLMIQYTVVEGSKSRWNVGIGASSYFMQSESYRYTFSQPNPGAKDGWDSRNSSRFFFNMFNITIGYERRIIPGLMLGIEPYAKIPLAEIGWSNLKLFSSGASITLRYTILQKKNLSIPTRSRGPD